MLSPQQVWHRKSSVAICRYLIPATALAEAAWQKRMLRAATALGFRPLRCGRVHRLGMRQKSTRVMWLEQVIGRHERPEPSTLITSFVTNHRAVIARLLSQVVYAGISGKSVKLSSGLVVTFSGRRKLEFML